MDRNMTTLIDRHRNYVEEFKEMEGRNFVPDGAVISDINNWELDWHDGRITAVMVCEGGVVELYEPAED